MVFVNFAIFVNDNITQITTRLQNDTENSESAQKKYNLHKPDKWKWYKQWKYPVLDKESYLSLYYLTLIQKSNQAHSLLLKLWCKFAKKFEGDGKKLKIILANSFRKRFDYICIHFLYHWEFISLELGFV